MKGCVGSFGMEGKVIADAASMGMPTERMADMFSHLFSEGTKTMHTDLRIEEATSGKVFVVTTSDRKPPIEVVVEEGNGRSMWRSGAYWGRINGEWGVLNLFQ